MWALSVNPPITDLHRGELIVSVKDTRGSITTATRTFSIGDSVISPNISATGNQLFDDDEFEVKLQGEPQSRYLIETTQDLIHWDPWQLIQDFDGVQKLTDTESTHEDVRFYRATTIQD
ncbi:MAG: hypothetical protein ACKVHP_22195 [Verrucomicrobiales bacterium]